MMGLENINKCQNQQVKFWWERGNLHNLKGSPHKLLNYKGENSDDQIKLPGEYHLNQGTKIKLIGNRTNQYLVLYMKHWEGHRITSMLFLPKTKKQQHIIIIWNLS